MFFLGATRERYQPNDRTKEEEWMLEKGSLINWKRHGYNKSDNKSDRCDKNPESNWKYSKMLQMWFY